MTRECIKSCRWWQNAAVRRREALQKQRQAQRELTSHARRLAVGCCEEESDRMQIDTINDVKSKLKKKTREERVRARKEYYSTQFMIPEWMIDIPSDLNGKGSTTGEGWYVLPRPEGKRCLVITNNGVTVARKTNGSTLQKFPSALPNGSRKTTSHSDGYCILDCIYQTNADDQGVFYVLDVLCWKGYLLYNCTTEFRLYWLREKLTEGNAAVRAPANPYPFLPIPCFECDCGGLETAYKTSFPYIKDGLLFIMKAAHYELGLSPCCTIWKDTHTSRFLVFTEKPIIVLVLNDQRQCTTMEGIVLYTIEDKGILAHHELREGDLIQFSFEHNVYSPDQTPSLSGMQFMRRCSPQRALPDSWTKVVFQYNARYGGISIDDIIKTITSSSMTDEKQDVTLP
uniref:Snurportin-1 n=1 Tax=Albugo laibachii Nc14 TaxID=890382 RepID=F0WE46_9STRA|nr:snurportinlike protein putative [Albugo laibachii Nc14]|eukprot:CCA19475.1 snurportinlike protein putative [Albugo laibachii Nc14]